MNFFKSLFKSEAEDFNEITLEFLEINRTKYTSGDSYLKWLKNKYGKLEAAHIVRKETIGNVPLEWEGKIKILEAAIEQEKNRVN